MSALLPSVAAALGASATSRVTVVRAGGLGDTLLVLPTLELLKRAAPGAEITLVGSAWAERLLPLLADPPGLLRFDSSALTPLFGGPAPAADVPAAIADAGLVVVYAADPDDAFVANVRAHCRGTVIAHPVHPAPGAHAAVHFARAVARVDNADDLPPPPVRVPAELVSWAVQWQSERLPGGPAPLAVHPGSGGRAKCWPPERFTELIRRTGLPVILVEGPADREVCDTISQERSVSAPVVRTHCVTLSNIAALLTRCSAYVGNDSGPAHLAARLIPTITIFGPTDPAVWSPIGPNAQAVAPPPGEPWPTVDQVADAVSQS